MNKDFIKKVLAIGIADTKRYRYVARLCLDGTVVIKRIARAALGTTAALTDASATNPDGWRIVYRAQ